MRWSICIVSNLENSGRSFCRRQGVDLYVKWYELDFMGCMWGRVWQHLFPRERP